MSNTQFTLQHPFAGSLGIHSKAGQQDALNNCVSVLSMLAGLLDVLDSAAVRRGMWINLVGVADLLTAISGVLATDGEEGTL